MNRSAASAVFALLSASSATAYAQTVDMNSEAYKTGHVIGQIFILVIVLLIIKKLFFSKK